MAYNTGNPIGSTDARDLSDNAQNFDEAINERAAATWTDRLGVARKTVWGAFQDITYKTPVSYATGLSFLTTDANKTVEESGVVYAPLNSALPFTTSGTFAGDDDARFYPVQDKNNVIRVTSIAAMEAYSAPVGYVFSLNAGGRSGVFDVVAGDFVDALAADTLNGVYVGLSDDATATTKVAKRRMSDSINVQWFGALGDGSTDDVLSIQAGLDLQADMSVSFQNATNETIGTAPVLFFPSGVYSISATLDIKTAYGWFLGEQSAIKKAGSFTGTNGLQMAANAWRLHFESLQIVDFEVGVYLDSSNLNSGQIGFKNCAFFGCTDRGLWLETRSSATTIEDCMFRANKHDLWVEEGDIVHLSGGWIQREGDQLTDDYDGSIVNYGVVYASNVLGVPQPETLISEPCWFKNYGNLKLDGFRFGGESGGITAVNNFKVGNTGTQDPKSGVILINCQVYVGNDWAIRLFELPNLIVLENCTGLTGSGVGSVGWSTSVLEGDQTTKIDAVDQRYFSVSTVGTVNSGAVANNLKPFVSSNDQVRLFGTGTPGKRTLIFDYLNNSIGANDIYGTMEWKGYDASDPANVGRRGSIFARATDNLGGLEIVFETGRSHDSFKEFLVLKNDGQLLPADDDAQGLGSDTKRWESVYAEKAHVGDGTVFWTSTSGSPEGSVSAPIGSLCTRTDGSTDTTLYVKESGAGNTGWVAK